MKLIDVSPHDPDLIKVWPAKYYIRKSEAPVATYALGALGIGFCLVMLALGYR